MNVVKRLPTHTSTTINEVEIPNSETKSTKWTTCECSIANSQRSSDTVLCDIIYFFVSANFAKVRRSIAMRNLKRRVDRAYLQVANHLKLDTCLSTKKLRIFKKIKLRLKENKATRATKKQHSHCGSSIS